MPNTPDTRMYQIALRYFNYRCGDNYLTWKIKPAKHTNAGDIVMPLKPMARNNNKISVRGTHYSYEEMLEVMKMLKCGGSSNPR